MKKAKAIAIATAVSAIWLGVYAQDCLESLVCPTGPWGSYQCVGSGDEGVSGNDEADWTIDPNGACGIVYYFGFRTANTCGLQPVITECL
jgi:hypothetical protein